jgi:transposase
MGKTFRRYAPDQYLLLPADLRQWLPEGHLALFVSDVVDELDLCEILDAYENGDGRGFPPYHPRMMVKLLVYGYCTGVFSSRKIERATYVDVAFRVLAANQHPDHDAIAGFRKRHLQPLAGLFLQGLRLCEKAGLVKLGHIAIDGTKIRANASKHKAMSYGRMTETEKKLEAEMIALLEEAQRIDDAEDALYGKGTRGDELPEELARRESRLKKIREAKAALEQEAREAAEAKAAEARAKIEERKRQAEETGTKPGGHDPKVPDPEQAVPDPKAQKNFTDPESRIMKDGASKSFEQCYNAQAAVDAQAQVIVAAEVVQAPTDKQQLVPMLDLVEENTGRLPEQASADSGYFSTAAVTSERVEGIELFVPPDKVKHGEARQAEPEPVAEDASVIEKMRHKLKTTVGRQNYSKRKAVVEPVFGQIKEARGFRRFSFRGLKQVQAEWSLVCLTHNLLKLFRAGALPEPA